MSEQTPELRWAPMTPKPKNRRRIWVIIGIVLAAVAIIGATLFFLVPRGDAPAPGASGSPGPSANETAPPPLSPTQTPEVTQPAPADPTIEVFRERVGGWLTDAPRGLDIIVAETGEAALAVVDTLEQDARRLSDAQPPSTIEAQWRDGVTAYAQRLSELNAAVSAGSDTADAVSAAREAVSKLQGIVGL
ncbi:hypothetical protein ACFVWL_18580 [Microbacterium sp. NPDC058269]|uniref:hypothetical protein n=1 Tax=Microbacterium sp. NPDC058269 TaxID=3346414 RepID=UPI0036D9DD08